MVTKSMSINRGKAKKPISKITGNFSENVFKISVKPTILQNLNCLLFFS